MSIKPQHEFAFSSFACCLADNPWTISERVEGEIEDLSNIPADDPMREFRQAVNLRKPH